LNLSAVVKITLHQHKSVFRLYYSDYTQISISVHRSGHCTQTHTHTPI